MRARRKFSVEYKREAVAMLDAPGVTVSQIATELGIGANVLGQWRRELRRHPEQGFVGNGRSRDEEVSQLRRDLARVTKERYFCAKRRRSSREHRNEVSDDPTVPRRVSHPTHVPLLAGFWPAGMTGGRRARRVRGLRRTPGYSPRSAPPYGIRRHQRQSADLGESARCRQALWAPPGRPPDA